MRTNISSFVVADLEAISNERVNGCYMNSYVVSANNIDRLIYKSPVL
jgi:hypothetical protein